MCTRIWILDLGGTRTADDFESGTAAAACGGVTTICDYAWQQAGVSIAEDDREVEGEGARQGARRLRLSRDPLRGERGGAGGDAGAWWRRAIRASRSSSSTSSALRRQGTARECCGRRGRRARMVNVHCENGEMLDFAPRPIWSRPASSDPRYYAGSRPALAEDRGHPPGNRLRGAGRGRGLHRAHVLLGRGRRGAGRAPRGLRVWGETRPIYLGPDRRGATRRAGWKRPRSCGAPPLRTDADLDGAVGRAAGRRHRDDRQRQHLVDRRSRKRRARRTFTRVPYGVPGLETEMRVMYSEGVAKGRLSLSELRFGVRHHAGQALRALSTQRHDRGRERRRSGGARSRGGRRRSTSGVLHSRAGYDPFHGFDGARCARLTLSRGEVIARDGELLSRPGRGQLVLRERKSG